MARRNDNAGGSQRTRKSRRGKRQHEQEQLSWPGKVARRIKRGIKKLVG